MVSKKSRVEVRRKKHMKLRNRFSGTAERPRLAVFRSNNHMYAQIIDDTVGNTLVSASTLQKDVKAELEKTNNVDAAAYLGKVIAEKAMAKGITEVVFDRGGFIYQGKIKAFVNELRGKSVEELNEELVAAKKELFNLRFQNATNQLDNTSRIKEVRKNIARIQTLITEAGR